MASKFLVALAIATGVFLGAIGSADAATYTWRIQGVFPEADGDWQVTMKGVKRLIEEASNGEIEVKIFPVGTLVEPDSVIDAVANGAIEGGHIIAGMAADRVPSCLATEMPFGVRDLYEHYELHFVWGIIDIMREEYASQNMHLLTAGFSGRLVFESSFPVRGVGDLAGKKIWAIPNALWLTEFGASTVEVPGLDMYSAIKLGTIDGMTWTMSELEVSNLKEVVKHVMMPPLLTPGTHIVINKKAWDDIGPELQRAVQNHVVANQIDLSRQYAENDQKAMRAAQEYGVQFTTLPPEDVAKMKAASEGFWDEIAGLGPHAKQMVESYRAYKTYRGID
jgi:TRAP-type C4-dicarboxylate transport system substrate-binding protein